jgi:phosphoribosylanthranilate isomerase
VTKLKICGICRDKDVEYVNECLPDYVGFVFAERSRRRVTAETAKRFSRALDERVLAVGVFQNASVSEIAELCNDGTIALAQLHGNEDEAYIAALKRLTNATIIKAVTPNVGAVSTGAVLPTTAAEFFLFDGKDAGSGKTFDWDAFSNALSAVGKDGRAKPFFLAGGINAQNATEAIRRFAPYCLDVSSGAELDGVKNLAKMKEIISITRTVKL